jgi:hypothetical protein
LYPVLYGWCWVEVICEYDSKIFFIARNFYVLVWCELDFASIAFDTFFADLPCVVMSILLLCIFGWKPAWLCKLLM